MRDSEGWYIAALRREFGFERRVEAPYMRWSQAWMLLALSRLDAVLRRSEAQLSH